MAREASQAFDARIRRSLDENAILKDLLTANCEPKLLRIAEVLKTRADLIEPMGKVREAQFTRDVRDKTLDTLSKIKAERRELIVRIFADLDEMEIYHNARLKELDELHRSVTRFTVNDDNNSA